MNAISKVTGVITFPARTALGAASIGVRTTARVLGWAAERAVRPAPDQDTSQWPSDPVTAPASPVTPPVEADRATDVDPMAPTRIPPRKAPARKPAVRKVPAGQVPLKSAPTPSLPAAVRAVEASEDTAEPTRATAAPAKKAAAKKAPAQKAAAKKAPAKKTAARKAPVRKTAAKKAPSKQAAVLAPALGLSESEVAEVLESDAEKS